MIFEYTGNNEDRHYALRPGDIVEAVGHDEYCGLACVFAFSPRQTDDRLMGLIGPDEDCYSITWLGANEVKPLTPTAKALLEAIR